MNKARLVQLIGDVPGVGWALRKLARRFPEGSVVEIRSGVAAGLRWKRFHRYLSGFWVGHFELEIQNALSRELKAGDVVYDVGANAGFFTVIAARLVGPSGRVVSFDPAPENVESVREQVRINGFAPYCTAVQQAVGGAEGRATFSSSAAGSPTGHLGGAGQGERSVAVAVTTLDAAVETYGRPTFIKLDVEGAEGEVMAGAARLLAGAGGAEGARRPTWLIELHGLQCEADVQRELSSRGYRFFDLAGRPVPADGRLPLHVIARPA